MSELKVEVEPFRVPNFVRAKDMPDGVSWPLSKIPADVLGEMCEQFSKDVFKKAGKQPPTRDVKGCPE